MLSLEARNIRTVGKAITNIKTPWIPYRKSVGSIYKDLLKGVGFKKKMIGANLPPSEDLVS